MSIIARLSTARPASTAGRAYAAAISPRSLELARATSATGAGSGNQLDLDLLFGGGVDEGPDLGLDQGQLDGDDLFESRPRSGLLSAPLTCLNTLTK